MITLLTLAIAPLLIGLIIVLFLNRRTQTRPIAEHTDAFWRGR